MSQFTSFVLSHTHHPGTERILSSGSNRDRCNQLKPIALYKFCTLEFEKGIWPNTPWSWPFGESRFSEQVDVLLQACNSLETLREEGFYWAREQKYEATCWGVDSFCIPGKWKLAGTTWFLSKLRQDVYNLIRHWVGLVSCPMRSADCSVWHVAQEQRVCLQPMTHPAMDQIFWVKVLVACHGLHCSSLVSSVPRHTWQVNQVKVPMNNNQFSTTKNMSCFYTESLAKWWNMFAHLTLVTNSCRDLSGSTNENLRIQKLQKFSLQATMNAVYGTSSRFCDSLISSFIQIGFASSIPVPFQIHPTFQDFLHFPQAVLGKVLFSKWISKTDQALWSLCGKLTTCNTARPPITLGEMP